MTPQHMVALERGNRIRLRRAGVKRELAELPRIAGLIAVGELVERTPPELEGMRLFDLVCACQRMGPAKAKALLRAVELPELKTVGSLTERQRGVFCDYVRALRGTVEVVELAPSQAVAA